MAAIVNCHRSFISLDSLCPSPLDLLKSGWCLARPVWWRTRFLQHGWPWILWSWFAPGCLLKNHSDGSLLLPLSLVVLTISIFVKNMLKMTFLDLFSLFKRLTYSGRKGCNSMAIAPALCCLHTSPITNSCMWLAGLLNAGTCGCLPSGLSVSDLSPEGVRLPGWGMWLGEGAEGILSLQCVCIN